MKETSCQLCLTTCSTRSEFKACWEGALADLTYHAKSKLVKWKIRTVPIKPDATSVEKIKWKNALKSDCSSLKTLYPHRIIRKNIGSNQGLVEIMRDHYTSNGQDTEGKCDKYSAFIVDENIYMRILKVCTHIRKKKPNYRPVRQSRTQKINYKKCVSRIKFS